MSVKWINITLPFVPKYIIMSMHIDFIYMVLYLFDALSSKKQNNENVTAWEPMKLIVKKITFKYQ